MIAQGVWFSVVEDLAKTQTGSPPTKGPNAGGIVYKSSAVAEMGDRGHNIHGPKRGRGGASCAPFADSWDPV